MIFFFSRFLNLSSRKNLQYKISHFYTDFWKKIVVSPDHTCAFMYHSPWQPALVLMSTSLFDYYFLSLPGFEPGYLFQRAWIVSTRPLRLTAGWSFWYILLLSTYLQVTQRYTDNKRQVRILLSPPLATEKEQPRPHSQTFPQPCLMAISISSPSPSPVSDYIHAPDFAVNIYCHDMAEV